MRSPLGVTTCTPGRAPRPHVAIRVAANPVGGRRLPGPRHIEQEEALPVLQRLAVHVPHLRIAALRAGIGHVEPLVIGRKANAIGGAHLIGHLRHLPRLRVRPVNGFLQLLRRLVAFVIAVDPVWRIGEPHAAVRMHHQVVRRVQPLAFELVRDHGHGAVDLIAHHAPAAVFGRELPALIVERVAIAVARRIAIRRDAPVVLNPAVLHVAGDVAPHQILPGPAPRRPFGPRRSRK